MMYFYCIGIALCNFYITFDANTISTHQIYNNMIVPKKILRRWRAAVKDVGITAIANGSGLNFRTAKRAYDSGECSDEVFDKITAYVVAREKEVAARIAKVEKAA